MSSTGQVTRTTSASILSAALTVGAVLLLALGPAPAVAAKAAAPGGAQPGKTSGGQVIQKGWWSRTNEPPPETGLLQPPSIPAAAAPAGTLPVALINGEPERVAAIEFGLKGATDSTVTSLVLALRESDAPGANANSELATLQACPVTEAFWVGVDNGPWATRPVFDCKVATAPGVRDDDGVWTFDLTGLASSWLSSIYGFSPAVVIVGALPSDPTAGPGTFQVGFDAEKGIGFAAATKAPTPVDEGDEDPDAEPETDAGAGTDTGSAGGGGFPEVSSGGSPSLSGGDLPVPDSGPVDLEGPASAPAATPAEPITAAVAPVAAIRAPWYSGLGVTSVMLLAVAGLLAYLMMLALGPQGRPVLVGGAGRRGVSRALDRRRATLAQITRRVR